jgi:putative endonuclease
MYYLYFLFSEQADKFYVGYSADPWKRLEQHLANNGKKFTGAYRDWKLVAVFKVSESKSDVVRAEKFIKQQKSRVLIEKILEPGFVGTGWLSQLVRVWELRD